MWQSAVKSEVMDFFRELPVHGRVNHWRNGHSAGNHQIMDKQYITEEWRIRRALPAHGQGIYRRKDSSAGNHQLMDKESIGGRVTPPGITSSWTRIYRKLVILARPESAHGRWFMPGKIKLRKKFSEHNFRINNFKCSSPRMYTFSNFKYEKLWKWKINLLRPYYDLHIYLMLL
jgi:hypothetical protein